MTSGTADSLNALKNHILICGWSPTVARILEGLSAAEAMAGRAIALVNQAEPGIVEELAQRYPKMDIRHVFGPYQSDATLRRAGCASAGAAIVVADVTSAPDADNRTIICTLALENINPEIKTCAELLDRDQEQNLKRAGVDEIVINGEHSGFYLSSGALSPGLAKAARRLTSFGMGTELRREEIPSELLNRTFGELQEHVRLSGAILIGIIREAEVVTVSDLFGSGQDWIDAFIKAAFTEAGEDVLERENDPIKVIINPPDDFVVEFKDSAILVGAGRRNG